MKYFSDYYSCPFCGASLDPGEVCDCQESTDSRENRTEAPQHSKEEKDEKERSTNSTQHRPNICYRPRVCVGA